MLEGKLEIRHGDKGNLVESGDSVYFDASTPHAYRCAGKTSAIALIVTMHQMVPMQVGLFGRAAGRPANGTAHTDEPHPIHTDAGQAGAEPAMLRKA
jgi:hypothetical protein